MTMADKMREHARNPKAGDRWRMNNWWLLDRPRIWTVLQVSDRSVTHVSSVPPPPGEQTWSRDQFWRHMLKMMTDVDGKIDPYLSVYAANEKLPQTIVCPTCHGSGRIEDNEE